MSLPARLPVGTIPAGTPLWRIHRRAHGPVWFGPAPGDPPTHRFDAPGGEYRACYFGDSPEVAFVETVVRGNSARVVPLSDLRARCATPVPLARDLRVVRLHSDGLVRLALPADVPHAVPYDRCQALALELWGHADGLDGIEYRSRWDDGRLCLALLDRASGALGPAGPSVALDDPTFVRPILRLYGIGIV